MPYLHTDHRGQGQRRLNKKGRRKRRRKLLRRGALLLAVILCLGAAKEIAIDRILMPAVGLITDVQEENVIARDAGSGISDAEVREKLREQARSSDKVKEILEQYEKYPEELLEMVANNVETADFVLDYPEKKDSVPADSIGEVTRGQIPLLLQWDRRWGYAPYGDNMIAVSGCGPTAVAMVAAGLTGDAQITPWKVAQYAQEQGYYAGDAGTSWELMTEGAQHFGVDGEEISLSESEIFSELESGSPIICSMRPGDFTTTGHFIVLTGTDGEKIRVNDPNSKARSAQLWDYETLEYQINNLWAFTEM